MPCKVIPFIKKRLQRLKFICAAGGGEIDFGQSTRIFGCYGGSKKNEKTMKTRWIMMAGVIALCGMAQAAFVTIGNAGNTADTTGYGAVGYTYQISATEVTIAEFMASGAGNGNENYWNDGGRTVGANAPASFVTLHEAMKYCNWRTSGNTNNGAYVFLDGVYQSTDRDSAIKAHGTVYALPTEDEWYKAAYYTGNSGSLWSLYANGTGVAPGVETDSNYGGTGGTYPGAWVAGTGMLEQNGTYDMMGNVAEWMETASGVVRGGSSDDIARFLRSSSRADNYSGENYNVGFRVVAIPEPSTALLLAAGGCIAWLARLKQRF